MLFILPLLLFPLEPVCGREMLFQIDIEADSVMWGAPFFDDDTPASAAQRFVDNVAAQFGHDFSHAIDSITRVLVERRALFGDNLEMEPRGPVLFSVPAPRGLGGAALPDVYFYEGDDPVTAWRRFCRRANVPPMSAGRLPVLSMLHAQLYRRASATCGSSRACIVSACKRNKGHFPGYEIQKPKVGDDVLALLLQLAREVSAAVCVETGTFRGETTLKLAESRHCPKVVTVELNPDFAAAARAKFAARQAANQDIVLLEGDSGDVLPPNAGLFPDDRNVLWFLDGHYAGLDTARGLEDSPIIVELDFILRTRAHRGDVVVIDDARTFRGSRLLLNMEVPWLFPELVDVVDHICELRPNMLVDIVGDEVVVRENLWLPDAAW
jgi:hypothetical protein